MFAKALVVLAASLALTESSPVGKLRTIYQYPTNNTWLENIAVRPNGSILLTSLERPGGISMINPFDANPKPRVIHRFPNLNSTGGIVETTPDTFYVAAANASLASLRTQPGSNYIFRLTFNKNGEPVVKQVAHVTVAAGLNGLVALNESLILAADSEGGYVISINVVTGESKVVIRDPLFESRDYEPVGVDGLKIRNGYLYFTNAVLAIFGRIPINDDGTPAGGIQVIATPPSGGQYDDFTFDKAGNAYAATGIGNSIQRIGRRGRKSIIAGSLKSLDVAEPSGVAFGRTAKDSNVLYISTGGASGAPVIIDGVPTAVGAQVLAIQVE